MHVERAGGVVAGVVDGLVLDVVTAFTECALYVSRRAEHRHRLVDPSDNDKITVESCNSLTQGISG